MIEVRDLCRFYGDVEAVTSVSFTIQPGEIIGLLGHNGAGKSTVMKMMSGNLEPSAGDINIFGEALWQDARARSTVRLTEGIGALHGQDARARSTVQAALGYLPESKPLYPDMMVADYLQYIAALKGIEKSATAAEIKRVMDAVMLADKALVAIDTLSQGYKQRVAVAQALLGKPKLLILDEPTNGLDPTQTQHMRALIKEAARDATVILSTHILQEVDHICDRVLIMRQGALALDATLETLQNQQAVRLVTSLDAETLKRLFADNAAIRLRDDKAHSASPTSGNVHTHIFDISAKTDANAHPALREAASAMAATVSQAGGAIYELAPLTTSLESVFRTVNETGKAA